ncbi:SDR family oxidoreductase [uncultured Lentibacter sp.]|uniref:SDR family oxidoreductase n=1 Tax=uncultured Lentibacter sp. TaxID=1659309 RepID=UPI002637C4D7|nr:SDR family oxidoreductase [uncultured Lentibacter sp.]
MSNTLLSIGHGYSARALAQRLLPLGWQISGTTRSPEKFAALKAEGVTPRLFPGGDLTEALDKATHLLVSAAPSENGDPFLAKYGSKLAQLAPNLRWVGYLSTTGVYGDHAGAWVTEDTPLTPSSRRGLMRVEAEEQWRGTGLPLHIFRLAGIYGPGRGPFEKLRKGTARRIIKEGQVFSRIHVEDIAQVLHASIEQPAPGTAYNVCDDMPAPPQDVLAYGAELLGMAPPPEVPFEEAELTPMARSFYGESKRVSNRRIKDALGVNLLYPDYRAGLQAVLATEVAE